MQRIRKLFETRLAYKVWLNTTVPILLIVGCVIIVLNMYLNAFMLDNAVVDAARDTQSMANKFSNTYADLTRQMVRHIASEEFRQKCFEAAQSGPDKYTVINNNVQSDLDEFAQMNGMIQSVVLARTDHAGGNPMVFSSYSFTLGVANNDYTLGYDLTSVRGITFLSAGKSPFQNRSDVVPLVVPIKLSLNQMLLIADDVREADLILYLLLDAGAVSDYLELCCDDKSEGILFLLDSASRNISLPSSDSNYDKIVDSDMMDTLQAALDERKPYIQWHGWYVYASPLGYGNLYVVNAVDERQFMSGADDVVRLLQLLALTCVVVITGVCVLISVWVTRPLRQLMATVRQIEQRSYDGKTRLNSKDELGQLEQQLNSMYKIIQRQIKAIKHEERERYNAEMQMLTEQINPHFLYNTLEFINMEVYSGSPENVSEMITNLGEYIRISLSSGDNQHTIDDELEQVSAYVDIMSCRFSKSINVLIDVPDELRSRRILKSILQPLVENSLKHGFNINGDSILLNPRIEIGAELTNTELLLTVTDNGAGIDVERAKQIMYTKQAAGSQERHVGLNNVYQRLHSYYANANITFSTIPYFRNTITIHLPACFFDGSGTQPPAP